MSEIFKDSEISVQSLALHKVLEGLIHNINTPLNLILGYSQQLIKQYPDIANLEKIYQAGLTIDDLMQSCARNIIQRLGRTTNCFDINQWLKDEVKIFNDVLEIKHKINIITQLLSSEVIVESSPLLLSLFLESLILYIRNAIEKSDTRIVNIRMVQNCDYVDITIQASDCEHNNIQAYLTDLQSELENYSGISFSDNKPFGWLTQDSEVKICVQVKGIE